MRAFVFPFLKWLNLEVHAGWDCFEDADLGKVGLVTRRRFGSGVH